MNVKRILPSTCYVAAMLGALVGLAAKAEAQAGPWSTMASACVLEPSTASKAQINDDGSIEFAGSSTGYLYFDCAVPFAPATGSSSSNTIKMSYIDPDGNGGNSYEVAQLQYSQMGVAGWNNVNTYVYSNSQNVTTNTTLTAGETGGTWDVVGYYFRVHVYMYRYSTSYEPIFYGVALYDSV